MTKITLTIAYTHIQIHTHGTPKSASNSIAFDVNKRKWNYISAKDKQHLFPVLPMNPNGKWALNLPGSHVERLMRISNDIHTHNFQRKINLHIESDLPMVCMCGTLEAPENLIREKPICH